MAKIVVTLKEKTLHEVIMHEDSVTTVGRDPSNNIHLVNPAVSRFHAKICSQGPDFYIEDLGSSNGTLLNDKMVPLTAELNNNDKITIGKYTLTFFDQKSEQDNVNVKKTEETIFVRKKEEPKKVPQKVEAEPTPGTPEPEPAQNQLLQKFSSKEAKIFIAVAAIIIIALTFFLLGYYL
jgi:pSer/pThr/pTyr-binding forkhead associated (FHA) protein